MANKEINIEKIMGEIRAEIEKNGYTKIDVNKDEIFRKQVSEYNFNEVEFNPVIYEKYLAELDSKKEVQAYRQLKSRPVVGGIIIFFKKVIRKCTKFYVEPIVESQNEVNGLITQLLMQLNSQVRIASDLESRIDDLEIKFNRYEDLNVEDIMSEIREDIKRKKAGGNSEDTGYEFKEIEFNPALYSKCLAELDAKREVQAYRQLKSRPVVGGIILFFKKIIRKCTKFYVEPIVESQNEVNELVTQLFIQLESQMRYTRELESRMDGLMIRLSKYEGDK